ncbi:hypothetical protein [Clostridium estertheticum]|uniref:hypothetical protein n=1 Tax=Clostridium estertheticum TaxID=238834 RepID=UPI001A9A71D8|nr:hypothetical protein [Clostridium estertheticum]MBU3187450.1 hypothetical protein [Clostridium estertheticum]MBZ9618594.1 hypothetical protein [Clostridium estertheticum subsp. laramiense]WAG76431.1 hypothetical protein LL032_24495 [Clostridium estertheticum]
MAKKNTNISNNTFAGIGLVFGLMIGASLEKAGSGMVIGMIIGALIDKLKKKMTLSI